MRLTASISHPSFPAPIGVAVDPGGNRLFIADALEHRLIWLDVHAGSFHTIVEPPLDGTPEVLAPVAAAVDPQGHLFVLAAGGGVVERYSLDSTTDTYSRDANFFNGHGSTFAGTPLSNPSDIRVHAGGLYVLDAGNKRVIRVDLAMGTATEVVSDSQIVDPTALAVKPGGDVLVADAGAHKVITYSQGIRSTIVGAYGHADGELDRPEGLEIGAGGELYVADSGNQRLQKFSANGVFESVIGSGSVFGSLQKIAMLNGRLYAADLGRGAVHVLGTTADGPLIEPDPETVDFGAVQRGLAVAVPVTIRNPGSDPLSVHQIISSDLAFSTDDTGFMVMPGGERTLYVTFEPPDASYRIGRLEIQSNSSVGLPTVVTLRGYGTVPRPLEAVLVLDRSGSMRQTAGARSKLELLKDAASLFIDLARVEAGDSIGVVSYSDNARTDHPFVSVLESPVNTRASLEAAVRGLAAQGMTAIGAGIEAARVMLPADGAEDQRRVLVVVSDGKENRPPYVARDNGNASVVDMSLYGGIDIYTVGLGLATEVDLGVLKRLATHGDRGAFYLTENDWLSLQKFFVEIFGDALGEYVALDPELEVSGTTPTEVAVNIGDVDRVVTFVVMWAEPEVDLNVRIITPSGITISAGDSVEQQHTRFGFGPTYAFYRITLPLRGARSQDHEGAWTVQVQGELPAGTRVSFEVCVLVRSLLGITCAVTKGSELGDPLTFEVTPTIAGRPVNADGMEITLLAPTRGRGETLASAVQDGGEKRTGELLDADHGSPAVRRAIAAVRAAKGIERRTDRLTPETIETAVGSMTRAISPPLIDEGAYEFRVVAEVMRNGSVLRRECRHGFALIARPDSEATGLRIVEEERRGGIVRPRIVISPRDQWGNLIGPGETPHIALSGTGAEISRLQDGGTGTYEAWATLPIERDSTLIERSNQPTPTFDPRMGSPVIGGVTDHLVDRVLKLLPSPGRDAVDRIKRLIFRQIRGRRVLGYDDVFLVVDLRGVKMIFSVQRALEGKPAAVLPAGSGVASDGREHA